MQPTSKKHRYQQRMEKLYNCTKSVQQNEIGQTDRCLYPSHSTRTIQHLSITILLEQILVIDHRHQHRK
jgi:hypothetical protein